MYLVKYSIKRLLMLIPVILGVTLILYFVMALAPGNPAQQILGANASDEQLAALEAEMGLDQPIIVQYLRYILRAVRLDFGTSWINGNDVLQTFMSKLPNTLMIALAATLWAVALGILSQILFCVMLRWLPATGVGGWRHLVLPALILGANTLAAMIRMSRTSMLDVLKQDYIRTARAKGASKRGAILKHAVGNSLIPVITQIGISFAGCIGGAVVTETVFTIPGIGAMLINAVKARDIPVVMGSVIFIALIVGVINLIVDLICAKVDPRIDLAA